MAIFGKCCCCDLKTGNLVLGGLCLLGALIGLGKSAHDINALNAISGQMDQLMNMMPNGAQDKTYAEYERASNAAMVSCAMYIALCILYIPASICLIAGAIKANRKLIAVFLVVDGINIILIFLKMVIIFIGFGFEIRVLITCLIAAGIGIFIWLFPFSLYQEVQDSPAGGAGSAAGGQVHYPAAGGKVGYPAQTQSYPAQTQSYAA